MSAATSKARGIMKLNNLSKNYYFLPSVRTIEVPNSIGPKT